MKRYRVRVYRDPLDDFADEPLWPWAQLETVHERRRIVALVEAYLAAVDDGRRYDPDARLLGLRGDGIDDPGAEYFLRSHDRRRWAICGPAHVVYEEEVTDE